MACQSGGASSAPAATADATQTPDVSRAPAADAAARADARDQRPDGRSPLPGDAGADATPVDGAPPDQGPADMARPPPRERPVPTTDLAAPAGWRWARGLIHMHSIHSHDACDGHPKDEAGVGNAPCLADLRAALCNARLDYTLLTDHPETFADVPFEAALLYDAAAGDELVRDATGFAVGNRLGCGGDAAVHTLIAPGSEGDIMPVLLPRPADDRAWYRSRTPEAVAALHDMGGLVFHAHTEERTFEELAPLGLDGIEIYNLHANVNPRWRQFGQVLPDILKMINAPAPLPHPDLSLLAVLRANDEALGIWNQFVVRQRMLGTAGSDIHQNLPALVHPTDGERLDSYRRLTTWFANYLLVREVTLDEIRGALVGGRLVVVFHLLGEPDGFDFSVTRADGSRAEMGTELAFEAGMIVRVTPPTGVPLAQQDVRLIRVTEAGAEVVAQGPMALEYAPEGPGVFRVEIHQTPEHLRGALGSVADDFIRPTPWISTNPIYVR